MDAKPKHSKRDRTGRYSSGPPCDGCGSPVGTDPWTDDEICGQGDGPGFFLCQRATCRKRREALEPGARQALYEQIRRQFAEWRL